MCDVSLVVWHAVFIQLFRLWHCEIDIDKHWIGIAKTDSWNCIHSTERFSKINPVEAVQQFQHLVPLNSRCHFAIGTALRLPISSSSSSFGFQIPNPVLWTWLSFGARLSRKSGVPPFTLVCERRNLSGLNAGMTGSNWMPRQSGWGLIWIHLWRMLPLLMRKSGVSSQYSLTLTLTAISLSSPVFMLISFFIMPVNECHSKRKQPCELNWHHRQNQGWNQVNVVFGETVMARHGALQPAWGCPHISMRMPRLQSMLMRAAFHMSSWRTYSDCSHVWQWRGTVKLLITTIYGKWQIPRLRSHTSWLLPCLPRVHGGMVQHVPSVCTCI